VKQTVDKLQRIERLRKHMADLSAWRLARMTYERGKLEQAHEDMLNALGEGLMAWGPPSAAGNRRVRMLERELAAGEDVAKDLARRALDDGRLAKLAEERLGTVREAWRETQARKSLEELIEATVKGSRKP
jgi:hypothetical protein